MTQEYSEEKARGTYGIIDEAKLDVEYHVCDLSSLKSIMKFVEWYKSTGRQVNILICNACTYTLGEGEKYGLYLTWLPPAQLVVVSSLASQEFSGLMVYPCDTANILSFIVTGHEIFSTAILFQLLVYVGLCRKECALITGQLLG